MNLNNRLPTSSADVELQIKTVKKVRYKGLRSYNMFYPLLMIIAVTLIILFFVFNAQYKSSVYVIYRTLDNISVASIIITSFLIGNCFMLLVVMHQIRKRKHALKALQDKENQKEEERISKIEERYKKN